MISLFELFVVCNVFDLFRHLLMTCRLQTGALMRRMMFFQRFLYNSDVLVANPGHFLLWSDRCLSNRFSPHFLPHKKRNSLQFRFLNARFSLFFWFRFSVLHLNDDELVLLLRANLYRNNVGVQIELFESRP